jgi:hypothetical protein
MLKGQQGLVLVQDVHKSECMVETRLHTKEAEAAEKIKVKNLRSSKRKIHMYLNKVGDHG